MTLWETLLGDVIGVDSSHLKLRSRCCLIFHDMLYVRNIQHNLLSIVALLGLGFTFNFNESTLRINVVPIHLGMIVSVSSLLF